MNLYRSVGNDPLNSLDPTGLFWYPGKYLIQLRREYYRGLELDRQINERRARQGLPQLEPPPHWTSVAAAEIGDGLRIGLQANVNAAATATRSLVTLGFWAEPWEVWAVADEDRPYYEGGFLAARVGWELLPSYGIGKLTQVPGRIGRWGRYALYWDTAQNAVQVGRGGYDIYENGLNWANGLQVGTGLLGLGGNYTTWRRLPGDIPNSLVWNSIRSTQPVYEGTVIPRSFELTTPYGCFWVHGNATRHFFEYAYHLSKRGLSPESVNLTSQVHLASFHAAVTEAARRGIRYNEIMVIGDWELKFALPREPSQLPAIIHARYRFGR